MLNSDEILKKIEESKNKIKKFGVRRIGLFGSYIRSEQKKESDIDVLVEFEKGKKTFDNYMNVWLAIACPNPDNSWDFTYP